MTKHLTASPSLEHLRKEAKAILKAQREGKPSCCSTLRNLHHLKDKSNDEIVAEEIGLTAVQFALAMDYGFKSWSQLTAEVSASSSRAADRPQPNGESFFRRYMNEYQADLETGIMEATGANGIRWTPGMKDESRWMGMEFMRPGGKMLANWNRNWPTGLEPPSWDSMCRIRRGGNSWERVYVYAAAGSGDLIGNCAAANEGDLGLVTELVDDAKRVFDVPFAADWLHGYYQHAIRLSVLGFLRANRSCGRLLFVYFDDDDGHATGSVPTRKEWATTLGTMDAGLGVTGRTVLERRVHRLFLPLPSTW
jgi:hypothetical protein